MEQKINKQKQETSSITHKRLDEIMLEKYPYITYDSDVAEEYLNFGAPKTDDEEVIAWCFVDYLLSQGLAEDVQL